MSLIMFSILQSWQHIPSLVPTPSFNLPSFVGAINAPCVEGLDDVAADFLDNYKKNVVGFTKKYKKDFGKLL